MRGLLRTPRFFGFVSLPAPQRPELYQELLPAPQLPAPQYPLLPAPQLPAPQYPEIWSSNPGHVGNDTGYVFISPRTGQPTRVMSRIDEPRATAIARVRHDHGA